MQTEQEKPKTIRRLVKLDILAETDPSPDLSWLGEYSNTPGPPDKTIDRQERGDMRRNEFRYFIAANSAAQTGNPESVLQDYKRMEELTYGSLSVYCVSVRAVIDSARVRSWFCFHLDSSTCGGIESDNGEEYIRQIGGEQIEDIRPELNDLGFTDDTINEALKIALIVYR